MEVILAAWAGTIGIIVAGIGVVSAVFRLWGPDYDDRNHN